MKKVMLFALVVASVSGSTAVLAQNQKNTSGQPVKSLTTTSYATATKDEVAKKEVKSDKKEVKKEAPKSKKESKPASTPAK